MFKCIEPNTGYSFYRFSRTAWKLTRRVVQNIQIQNFMLPFW